MEARLKGRVIRGDGRGRTIGFPTANVEVDGAALRRVKHGVYVAEASVGAQRYVAVVNLGRRPTFEGTGSRLEAHLLDFEGDLYDSELDLSLLSRLRDERAFDSVEGLVEQIHADVEATRQYMRRSRETTVVQKER